MIIKNYKNLATSTQRARLLKIAEAGLESINTVLAVRRQVKFDQKKQKLEVLGKKFDLSKFRRIYVVGFGKASLLAAEALKQILGDRIFAGAIIDLTFKDLGQIESYAGTHPLASLENVEASKRIFGLLQNLSAQDLVICLVSGGGSALFSLPFESTANEQALIFKSLTAAGANILELNTVRKHIDSAKGGHLAKHIYPAACISLIFSDVPGNDISMVASGPTVKDTTSIQGAREIMKKYQILEKCNLPFVRLKETPKEEKYFKNVHNFLFVSAKTALYAMKEKAEELGLKTKIFSPQFQGEARKLGPEIINCLKKGMCVLAAGESTVKITGLGIGGRNMEMVLSVVDLLKPGQTFGAFASDGRDNTEAAGAIADITTAQKARTLVHLPENYMNNNDSFHFFESTGDLVETGITGSNISDFVVCLED